MSLCQQCGMEIGPAVKKGGPPRKYCGEMCRAKHGRAKAKASGYRATREWRDNNRQFYLRQKYDCRLRRAYGIDTEDLARMYDAQDRKCAACVAPLYLDKETHIDHCHRTLVVRGLLCVDCNVALGRVCDSPDTLRGLVSYLEKPRGANTPTVPAESSERGPGKGSKWPKRSRGVANG